MQDQFNAFFSAINCGRHASKDAHHLKTRLDLFRRSRGVWSG